MKPINIRKVTFPHYLTSGEDDPKSLLWKKKLPPQAKRWAGRMLKNRASEALIATRKGKMIGFLRYELTSAGAIAHGTWISASMRGRGLSRALWKRLANKVRSGGHITVSTISAGGRALVESMRRDSPHIRFRHIRLGV